MVGITILDCYICVHYEFNIRHRISNDVSQGALIQVQVTAVT